MGYYLLGDLYYEQQTYYLAIYNYQQCLKFDENNYEAMLYLAQSFQQIKKFNEAN